MSDLPPTRGGLDSVRERPRLSSLCRVLGKLILAGLFTVILLEALVRLVLPQQLPHDIPGLWQPDETIGWRHTPNVRLVANTGEREVDVCTNARGDRIACGATKPNTPPCNHRILAIGDSFVEALAIPFEDTVWARIEQHNGSCVAVSGVGRWGPAQYLADLHERLQSEPWDLVLYHLYLGNDLIEDPTALPSARSVQKQTFQLLPSGVRLRDLRRWFYPFNSLLERRSHAYVAMRAAVRRLRDPAGVGIYGVPSAVRASLLTAELIDGTVRNVALAARAAQTARVPLVVVLIPHSSQVLDPDADRLLSAFPELAGEIDMGLTSKRLAPQLRQVPGVEDVIDLLPWLRERADDRAWGRRDRHFSPQGHALWFEALLPMLQHALEPQATPPAENSLAAASPLPP